MYPFSPNRGMHCLEHIPPIGGRLQVPPVLIVHLKRFAGSSKISSLVTFPLEGLDLSEVVKSPQVTQGGKLHTIV